MLLWQLLFCNRLQHSIPMSCNHFAAGPVALVHILFTWALKFNWVSKVRDMTLSVEVSLNFEDH